MADPTGKGSWAVVTGASSGIGRELAKVLAERGYDVVVVADEAAVHDVVSELDGNAVAIQCDLATRVGNDRLVEDLRTRGISPEVVCLDAGVGVAGRFDATELDDDLRLVELNVASTVHLAKVFSRQMVAEGRGRLLLTSSVASQMPGPGYATYAASKSFVQSFAEGIRVDLDDTGVSVTALLSGPTDTQFFDRAGMQHTRVGESSKDDAAQVAREGVDALMAGRDRVVAGSIVNRVQVAAAGLVPDGLKARIHATMTAARPAAQSPAVQSPAAQSPAAQSH